MIEISTERLTIKKMNALDKARLIELIGDPRVSQTLSNVPYPYTDEDAEYWMGIVHFSEVNLNIYHDGLLIGGIGLTPQGDDSCELGYWLGFDYWGKGYATEACNALLDYASAETCFRQVRANVYEGNSASSNVLEKVGFKQIGTGEVFSLSKQKNIPCLSLRVSLARLMFSGNRRFHAISGF